LKVFKLTLILLLLFTFACRRQKTKKGHLVLFDAYKEQVWSIKDTGFAGYSSLNLFLQDLGFNTAENHKPYREVLPYLDTKSTLFIIGVAMEAQFSEDEVKHILDFVGRGGKILVIAEHDNKYGSSDFLRPLINSAGWEISNGRIVEENDAFPGTAGRWTRTALPSMREGPVFLCAAILTAVRKEDCEVLLTSLDGNYIVAGLGRYKKGQIAILADSEFLWNANSDYKWKGLYSLAFSDSKTRTFIKDIILRILPPKEFSKSKNFSFSGNLKSSKRVFVYGNGGDFNNYSKFLTVLTDANISVFKYQEGIEITPEDRVIVITPLVKIPQGVVNELSKSEKMVILGDMYTSVKSYAESWKFFFEPHKIYPVPYPINTIAEKYGVRFLPCFGVNFKDNEYGNILYVPVSFNKKRIYLHKACAIELLKGNKNKEIYFENFEETFACAAGFGLNHPLKFKDPKDIENPDFLIATDNILAIGDSDIIANDFLLEAEHNGFLEMIIKFLKSEYKQNK